MSACIFCQIVEKQAPATIVFESSDVLGIVPLDQVTEGHILLIPKKHSTNIFDIDAESMRSLAEVVRVFAPQLRDKYQATGINILNANGADAQQTVFHTHIHLIPRRPNDGL
ncbi:MAG: HIT family protein, partial [Candidatus Paceibacterota bacterium]